MTKIPASVFAVSLFALGLGATPADAQSRVFVGIAGNDANPCTVVAPCRTFQRAHDAVAANGEIDVLDPAGYGAVTITKAISIQGHGFAGITAAGGANAITINGGAGVMINLRGLLIEGVGAGGTGIASTTGASLNVQDSVIRNFANAGIVFLSATASSLFVSNTLISDCVTGNGIAIYNNGSSIVAATLDGVQLVRNFTGIDSEALGSGGTTALSIVRSVVTHNVGSGIYVNRNEGPITSTALIRDTTISNNGTGVNAAQGATVRISHSVITANATSWTAAAGTTPGVLRSYGDNNIDGNSDANPSPTTIVTK